MALAVFLVGSIGVVHPRILNWWAAILSRYTRQPYRELQVRWITLAGIWLSYLAMWLVLGIAVALFVGGVMAIPAGAFPRVAGGYVAAWVASMIAVIAPAGMGVRDGIFGLLLRRMMPVGAAFTIALAVRLWITVIGAGLGGVAQTMPSGQAPGGQQETTGGGPSRT